MKHRLPTLTILDIPIVCATEAEAIAEIQYLTELGGQALVIYVNAHTLELTTEDPEYRKIVQEAAIVMNDGIGVSLAAKIVGGRSFPANLNGTDLTPLILKMAAEQGWRVFLLGGVPGVAEKAAAKFVADNPTLEISGTHAGFFKEEELDNLLQRIRDARTDVLIVGMGNPVQERWLACNQARAGARLGVGVGAFLDFSAGMFPRAPLWVQKIKLEWLYRMSREPRRLWKRYLIEGPLFLIHVVQDAVKQRRAR
ncbi:WecB/TagA/CpsF family glycosyltransferase [Prosthecobacter sp.]|uniref:WecB/TagA/CpsF family glycosyltransferase n=1 Tax=Prosthecobacter sp. TaxID=1965333 RepID=UPI001D9ABC40|nr:WecB/TagA/CpsF family glycosyltransferase [Prosthecobacter sp.]MCB1277596.1 WecB/TagA/CpsF family glycosyltransferase [Prosthecobacter sp.]